MRLLYVQRSYLPITVLTVCMCTGYRVHTCLIEGDVAGGNALLESCVPVPAKEVF